MEILSLLRAGGLEWGRLIYIMGQFEPLPQKGVVGLHWHCSKGFDNIELCEP
jgi:hypothetical protein